MMNRNRSIARATSSTTTSSLRGPCARTGVPLDVVSATAPRMAGALEKERAHEHATQAGRVAEPGVAFREACRYAVAAAAIPARPRPRTLQRGDCSGRIRSAHRLAARGLSPVHELRALRAVLAGVS